jgi:hypothetical protein
MNNIQDIKRYIGRVVKRKQGPWKHNESLNYVYIDSVTIEEFSDSLKVPRYKTLFWSRTWKEWKWSNRSISRIMKIMEFVPLDDQIIFKLEHEL